jgi:hypothetical protein
MLPTESFFLLTLLPQAFADLLLAPAVAKIATRRSTHGSKPFLCNYRK